MTDDSPPVPPRTPRGRARRQPGFDDEAVLSPEEVARRVDVRGGATPRAPIERAPVRDRRPPPRRPGRTAARDSLLLVGLVIVGLVAVRLFLPDGPLSASATAAPGGTQAAVATRTPEAPSTGSPTGGLITLPPTPSDPAASPGPITAPPITAPPLPTPTLKPGQTRAPTPRPTRTPTITAGPTPQGTSQLYVVVNVSNGDGGTVDAGAWKITVTSVGTVTPGSFNGQTGTGTLVTLSAGVAYSVSSSGPSGYAKTPSSNCSSDGGGLPVTGNSETCTIYVNDIAPKITVYTVVDGGGSLSPSGVAVSVIGTDVKPGAPFPGSSTGIPVTFDANTEITITQSGGEGEYDKSQSGTCAAVNGLELGATATCTFTFTYIPPPEPTESPATGLLLPLLAIRWRGRPTWRSTPAG